MHIFFFFNMVHVPSRNKLRHAVFAVVASQLVASQRIVLQCLLATLNLWRK